MKRRRLSGTQIAAVLLFLAACTLGVLSQKKGTERMEVPRARYSDGSPLGGKGLRLLFARLGYQTKRATKPLDAMPADAKVWMLLDAESGFSRREADLILEWVKRGNTLIWAATPNQLRATSLLSIPPQNSGVQRLLSALAVSSESAALSAALRSSEVPLPPLTKLGQSSLSDYWTGVSSASGSGGTLQIEGDFFELAGTPIDAEVARIPLGKGRVFVAPDALMFTNYALSSGQTAVFVSNLVRLHAAPGATIYFDEREHGEDEASAVQPSLLYYLWQPPLRYAVLQLVFTALLLGLFFGRRLGAPALLPGNGPVTRASQFAGAMGSLFQKVGRPRVATSIIGEHFRRNLCRRLGLSPTDSDALIAQRAAQATGYSARVIDRLLLQAKTPEDDESRALAGAQEMEKILRSLDKR